MRWAFLSAGLAVLMVSPSALTQDSLCNPCVDPPSVTTAEDMRALGIVSVADMINQLPQAIADEAVVDSEESQANSDEEDGATSEADSQPSDE